jgi:hypothetical protein
MRWTLWPGDSLADSHGVSFFSEANNKSMKWNKVVQKRVEWRALVQTVHTDFFPEHRVLVIPWVMAGLLPDTRTVAKRSGLYCVWRLDPQRGCCVTLPVSLRKQVSVRLLYITMLFCSVPSRQCVSHSFVRWTSENEYVLPVLGSTPAESNPARNTTFPAIPGRWRSVTSQCV